MKGLSPYGGVWAGRMAPGIIISNGTKSRGRSSALGWGAGWKWDAKYVGWAEVWGERSKHYSAVRVRERTGNLSTHKMSSDEGNTMQNARFCAQHVRVCNWKQRQKLYSSRLQRWVLLPQTSKRGTYLSLSNTQQSAKFLCFLGSLGFQKQISHILKPSLLSHTAETLWGTRCFHLVSTPPLWPLTSLHVPKKG